MSERLFRPVVVLAVLCVTALLPAGPPAAAADAEQPSEEEVRAARQEILALTARHESRERQFDIIAGHALLRDDAGPAMRIAARRIISSYHPDLIIERTARIFDRLSAESQSEVVRLYDSLFPKMTGKSFVLLQMIARAADSPHPEVRREADGVCARRKVSQAYFVLRRRANRSEGEDRIRAIETLGLLGDKRAGYFLPTLLDSDDPEVRRAAYTALGRIGRAGTLTLKERLHHGDPEHRTMAVRALMPGAIIDDLPAFYGFLQANPSVDEELKEELYALIARLEVIRDKGVETPRN